MALSGLISTVFASKKALDIAETVAEKAPDMVDNLFHTDQEKTAANLQWFSKWADMMVQIKDENSARSITRRILAIFIATVWSVFATVALVCVFVSAGSVAAIIDVAVAFSVGWVMLAVVAFYFGVNLLDRMKK